LNYKTIWNYLELIIIAILIAWLIEGGLSWLGFIGFIIIIALINLWMMRDTFKMMLNYVETLIWGKPLTKEYWKKGELKDTKVKFVWKKKQKQN
jgi:hypothetical protein